MRLAKINNFHISIDSIVGSYFVRDSNHAVRFRTIGLFIVCLALFAKCVESTVSCLVFS